jgi:hypothetical protein
MKCELFYSFEREKTLLRTLEEVTVIIDGESITIPAGFEFDGASIPRIFWRVEAPIDGRYITAFCVHDWCYSSHCVGRKKADTILYSLLREAGMGWIKARTIYRAVRLFRTDLTGDPDF